MSLESNPNKIVERLSKEIDRMLVTGGSSASHLTVNAGGIGVWICTILFSINLAFLIALSVSVGDKLDKQDLDRREDRAEIKRLNEYLLAIWAKAPYLKPEEKKDARPNHNP